MATQESCIGIVPAPFRQTMITTPKWNLSPRCRAWVKHGLSRGADADRVCKADDIVPEEQRHHAGQNTPTVVAEEIRVLGVKMRSRFVPATIAGLSLRRAGCPACCGNLLLNSVTVSVGRLKDLPVFHAGA